MASREMGESSIQGDMIRMPLGDGGFAIYPYKFAYDAINKRKFSLFVVKGSTDEDASILMATHSTGARTILVGDYDKLIEQLRDIPWKDDRIATTEGPAFRKIAPSLDALEKMMELLKNTTTKKG